MAILDFRSFVRFVLAARGFRVQDELPGALQNQIQVRQIVPAEARRLLPVVTVLVRTLNANLVECDFPPVALALIGED